MNVGELPSPVGLPPDQVAAGLDPGRNDGSPVGSIGNLTGAVTVEVFPILTSWRHSSVDRCRSIYQSSNYSAPISSLRRTGHSASHAVQCQANEMRVPLMVCCSSIVPLVPQCAHVSGVWSAIGVFGTGEVSRFKGSHWITTRNVAAISHPSRQTSQLRGVSQLQPSDILNFRRTFFGSKRKAAKKR